MCLIPLCIHAKPTNLTQHDTRLTFRIRLQGEGLGRLVRHQLLRVEPPGGGRHQRCALTPPVVLFLDFGFR